LNIKNDGDSGEFLGHGNKRRGTGVLPLDYGIESGVAETNRGGRGTSPRRGGGKIMGRLLASKS